MMATRNPATKTNNTNNNYDSNRSTMNPHAPREPKLSQLPSAGELAHWPSSHLGLQGLARDHRHDEIHTPPLPLSLSLSARTNDLEGRVHGQRYPIRQGGVGHVLEALPQRGWFRV